MGEIVESKKVKKENKKKRKTRKDSESGFKRLKELDCFPEVESKVKAGVSPDEVGRWLQEDMFQMTDIKRESVVRQLYRYKSSLPPAELLSATPEPPWVTKAIEKMKRGIDELDELEKLYLLQLQRISIDAKHEEKISKLFKGTNREIQVATELLEKRLKLKMDLGILDKSPQKTQIDGIVSHVPVDLPEGMDEKSADKTMVRMGLAASKLFKAIEQLNTDDVEKKEEQCQDEIH